MKRPRISEPQAETRASRESQKQTGWRKRDIEGKGVAQFVRFDKGGRGGGALLRKSTLTWEAHGILFYAIRGSKKNPKKLAEILPKKTVGGCLQALKHDGKGGLRNTQRQRVNSSQRRGDLLSPT